MNKVFLIPGLGADTRLYNNIDIPEGYDFTPIDWIEPHISDTLVIYAQKLIYQYDIKQGTILIGTSLGGMLAIEIAKKVNPAKVILISSIKTIDEAPWYFPVFRKLPVHKLLPMRMLTSMGFLIRIIFGSLNDNDTWLFNDMLQKNSPFFMKWAMGAVLQWDNKIIPPNVYHIHGDKDLVFPIKTIKNATVVKGATHIMVFDRAKEINKWLKAILKK
jgi:pimeloyl-ACP methyl ester carboxylesterase